MLSLLLLACVDPSQYAENPQITNHVEDWRDEVIYQVLIDRFANGDVNNDYNVTDNPEAMARYMGGDYQGLIEQVDYLDELGVTAVWVSPIVVNVEEDAGVSSYHGYWTQDFTGVNPHFGDLTDFRQLVDTLHEHDIKVILDIVANHVGQLWYYDINRNGQPDTTIYGSGSMDDPDDFWEDSIEVVMEWDPPYDEDGIQAWTSLGYSGEAPLAWVDMPEINRVPPEPAEFANEDWYNRRGRVTDWDDREQVVKGDFPGGLKDLDTSKPEVRDALIDVFQYWIEATNIDGYRIDTVKHVEHGFWSQFSPAMREHAADLGKEEFLLFGEVFDGDDELIGSYTAEDELDSLFYFSHKFQIFDDIYKYGSATSKVETLYAERGDNYRTSPQDNGISTAPHDSLITFIDNHDIPRFLYDQPDEGQLRMALMHLLTMDGVPCIYYGTEQAFDGGNDPANREPMWWSEFDTTGAMFEHTRDLIAVRKAYPAMSRGDFTIKWASDRVDGEEDAHLVAWERSYEGQTALVVLNTWSEGSSHTSYEGNDMPVSFPSGTTLKVAFPIGDDRSFSVSSSGTVKVEVDAQEGLVLVPADELVDL